MKILTLLALPFAVMGCTTYDDTYYVPYHAHEHGHQARYYEDAPVQSHDHGHQVTVPQGRQPIPRAQVEVYPDDSESSHDHGHR